MGFLKHQLETLGSLGQWAHVNVHCIEDHITQASNLELYVFTPGCISHQRERERERERELSISINEWRFCDEFTNSICTRDQKKKKSPSTLYQCLISLFFLSYKIVLKDFED